ncbi:MAG: hypothetical protein JST59_06765 [Actinobacteria bacterium]|nr:hypothetical protein [Actinomycetota bacterium]
MDGTALIAQSAASSSSNNLDIGTATGKVAIERGWLFEGQPIDVGTKSNATSALSNNIIEEVDDVNFGLKLSGGNFTSEASTLFVSQHGARVGEVSNEMNGIQNIISATTTLGGVSPSSQRQWKATVDNSTTTLTITALLTAQRKIRQKQGKAPTFFLTGLLQQQRFYELLEQQVQFGSDKGLEAGNDEVAKWNGMEIFGDPDCPDNLLAMGHFDHFFMVQQDDPYWQNKHTGGEKLAWIQGTDSYGGKLTWRANIAVDRRNDLFLFNALT